MSKSVKLLLWLLAIGAVLTVALVVGVILLSSSQSPSFMEKPRWLRLKVATTLSETPGSQSIFADPEDLPPLLTETTRMVRNAANDPNIIGLAVEMEPFANGWGLAQELKQALDYFAEKKPCKVWADSYSNKEFYIASACQEIHLAPTGITLVNGLSMTNAYYKNVLDKLDVKANFEHVGKFKSAVEPYKQSGPSEEAKEATNFMLDSLYEQMLNGMVSERLTKEKVTELVNDPPISGEWALKKEMVTSLSYKDEVFDKENVDFISSRSYLRQLRRKWNSNPNQIAIVFAEGAIMNGESGQTMFGGQMIGDKTVISQLKRIRKNGSVKGVVLRVNSPGGSGSASDNIWHEIENLKKEKIPFVVSMSDYAASGGYYISMGADVIFAQPATLTGSIGVFGGKFNLTGLYAKMGIDMVTESRGDFAELFSTTKDFTQPERQKYQQFLSGFYEIFLNKAAQGRGKTREQIDQYAQGRVWTGEQAVEYGLVDKIGGLHDAIAEVERRAGISNASLVFYPEYKSFWEELLSELSDPPQDSSILSGLDPLTASLMDDLMVLHKVLQDYGVAAMLPYRIDIH